MAFRGQVERSFRVPTFNDRYWPIPGAEEREDLRSESGYSTELGHNFTYRKGRLTLESDITLYYMKIDDWIMWVPNGSVWMPENKKKVEGSGVELSAKINMDMNQWSFDLGGMYAFNNSVLLEGVSEDDPAVGYQLPYTPQHRAVLFASMNYKNYRLSINNTYTGKRNGIDVRSEKVDGYLVTDIGLSKRISLGKQLLTLEGKVLNLFDVEYQNVNQYAMPGRNYLISIIFFIKN